MGQQQIESLNRDGRYISAPKGVSMRPMIISGRDAVLVEKIKDDPKRYDLLMYEGKNDMGIIHRVIHAYDVYCIICGDNCWRYEHVDKSRIKGIVTKFYRKGKWHDVDEIPYKLYVHLWVDFIFFRRIIFYIRDKIKRFKK
ncbi:MAG: S24/S26 family peptidase [Erysipelotrichaceae bacterium]|nr:S24/S26 family peptidase [Erysipelotrichaceae bacterium]